MFLGKTHYSHSGSGGSQPRYTCWGQCYQSCDDGLAPLLERSELGVAPARWDSLGWNADYIHVQCNNTMQFTLCIPGGTHTQGNVRMCSARLVSRTWPSDDSSKPATATLTPWLIVLSEMLAMSDPVRKRQGHPVGCWQGNTYNAAIRNKSCTIHVHLGQTLFYYG